MNISVPTAHLPSARKLRKGLPKWNSFLNPEQFQKESYEKLLHALSITQISKEDYADFHNFSMCFVSV
jgi:hypothetical protein